MLINIAASKSAAVAKASAVTLLCASVIIFSKECSQGVMNGIKLCLEVLIPSLFPFMAIASFAVNSNIIEIIGKPFKKTAKAMFGLGHCFAPVILLSLIGGYPVGARAISSLYQKGSADKSECKKAALFAVCAGPGFLINYVGMSLYNSKTIGIILLVSQMLSVIITGIFLKFFYKEKSNNISNTEIKYDTMTISDSIVQAAIDSSRGMISICAFVVLFSAISGIVGAIIPESETTDYIYILLEVCTAVNNLAAKSSVELIAFATGFGGISIHFQIYSILGKLGISKLLFFCIRIMQGIIAALITHFGLILLSDKKQVFSSTVAENVYISAGTLISGAALLGIAICFLYSIKNCKQK